MKVCFEVKKKRAWVWEGMKVAFEVKKNGVGESLSMCIRRGRELFEIYIRE